MNELGEYGQDEVLLMISSSQSERVLVSAWAAPTDEVYCLHDNSRYSTIIQTVSSVTCFAFITMQNCIDVWPVVFKLREIFLSTLYK